MPIKKKTSNGSRRSAAKISKRQPSSRSGTSKTPSRSSSRAKSGSRAVREPEPGGMTVREAGRKGGLIGGRKGGLAVKAERGRAFYQEIGRMGGKRVRDLIAAGRKATEKPVRRRHT